MTMVTKNIRKGDELCHIYYGHFGDTPLETRQKNLKIMYHFQCSCLACKNDYPRSQNLPKKFSDCPQYVEKFGLEEALASDKKLEKLNESVSNAMARVLVEKALGLYLERASWLCETLEEPHVLFLQTRSAIIDLSSALHGYKSLTAEDTIRQLRKQYLQNGY